MAKISLTEQNFADLVAGKQITVEIFNANIPYTQEIKIILQDIGFNTMRTLINDAYDTQFDDNFKTNNL